MRARGTSARQYLQLLNTNLRAGGTTRGEEAVTTREKMAKRRKEWKMKRERRFVKQRGGKSTGWWKKRGEKAATTAARGQQLVLGCILIIPQAAREPHPISLALSPFLSLSIFRSPPLRPRRGLRRPLLVSQASRGTPPKREQTKAKRHRGRPTALAPSTVLRLARTLFDVSSISCLFPLSWSGNNVRFYAARTANER